MKISLIFLAAVPFIVSAGDMQLAANMKGLPEDFKRYFYNSEVVVQVYLNDNYIFDASASLSENGEIKLLRIIDEQPNSDHATNAIWSDVLQKGVSAGKCTLSCPSGLMQVDYSLDNSALKLYTANYETSQVVSNYLSVPDDTPAGLIMSNSVSLSEAASMRSWGINSSLTSSLGGWSQQVAFQSTGTEGEYHYNNYSIYQLFTQKELKGSFFRLGLFTPDSDNGNVQTSGFGNDTVIGGMWGTSDALLATTDSVSAWPVYVTGRNQSIAEVWRNGQMIRTQQLQPGIQALDTRPLPLGIYDITIKVIENGQVIDTQEAQIFKAQGWNNPDKRWRMNLWGGQRRTLGSGDLSVLDSNPFTAGAGVELLVNPRATVGFSGAITEKEQHLRTRTNITLSQNDRFFAQYTLGSSQYQANQDTDIRYYRNLYAGGSASLYWRSTLSDVYGHRVHTRQTGQTWGASLSSRLPRASSLIFNAQYIDTPWRKGAAADVSLSTQTRFLDRDTSLRMSAYDRPAFDNNRRDRGISFSVSIALSPAAEHSVSFSTGLEQDQSFSSLQYQWEPTEKNTLRNLGAGVSWNAGDTVLNGNGAVDTPWVNGNFYAQHGMRSKTSTAGANLSQVLVMGGGKIASVNGDSSGMQSAVIVDMDADDKNTRIQATGSMSELSLKPGRNILPAELWKKSDIQFSARGGDSVQVFPERQSIQMNRGSVQYLNIKTVKTFTLIGMLQDEQGQAIRNRYVKSDVTGAMVNAEGVLTLDTGTTNRQLTVSAENGQPELLCQIPSGLEPNKKVQFISAIQCQRADSTEK